MVRKYPFNGGVTRGCGEALEFGDGESGMARIWMFWSQWNDKRADPKARPACG